MNWKKLLGIDYGDYTIGLAIFDFETKFFYPYKTIFRERENVLRKSIREIVDIIEKEKIDEIVMGLPLSMDGSEGDRVLKVKKFSEMLSNKKNIKINFQDERLTTKEAKEILIKRGVKAKDQKKIIDQMAAMLILKDYVNSY